MKRIHIWLILSLAALLNAGCFQSTVRVVVKPDGTGTIAVSQILDNATLDLMRQNQSRDDVVAAFASADAITAAGAAYGKNVELVMSRPSKKSHGAGYLAIYRFEDINDIRIAIEESGKAFHFEYTAGKLTAHIPQIERSNVAPEHATPTAQERNEALAGLISQLRQKRNAYGLSGRESLSQLGAKILGGLKASVELDLPPETNTGDAQFVDPQRPTRVTLLNIEGEKLAGNTIALNRLLTPSASVTDILAAPGVQLESQPTLTFTLE